MAEEKSDSSKHQSMYGGGFITSAQFICELMFEKIAKKRKKKLSNCFWNDPYWKKDYQWQIIAANRLLKKYAPSVLIGVLKDPAISYKIISLGAIKPIEPLLNKLQTEYEQKQKEIKESIKIDPHIQEINENPEKFTEAQPQKAFSDGKKKNILNKLKGL